MCCHLLEFSVSLSESVSLAGNDGQDGCIRGVWCEWYWSCPCRGGLEISTQECDRGTGSGGGRTLGFFPNSIPASASEDVVLFRVSRASCLPFTCVCWCFSISSRSFSSFSLSCCCFSNLELTVMSSSWAVCNDASNSPWRICSRELSDVRGTLSLPSVP